MELEASSGAKSDFFWKTLFSDLESTGILRGKSSLGVVHACALNEQVQVALAKVEGGPVSLETRLQAAWAAVLARHTSSSEVIFLASFDEGNPWLGLVRATVSANGVVSDWLAQFEETLRLTKTQGPIPPASWAHLPSTSPHSSSFRRMQKLFRRASRSRDR